MIRRRAARQEDLGLTRGEYALLARLDSPRRIQAFLYSLRQNFELNGDTCRPVRVVLEAGDAHCIEGAMVAACALWIHGEPPLVMDMRAVQDYDHVVALYRRGGRWGAFSKTNGLALRSRDPVYRTLRELAMSYFHEYYNRRDLKTLREYSVPLDLRRVDPAVWVSGTKNAWPVVERLDALRHFPLVERRHLGAVTRRDPFERLKGWELQYPKPRELVLKLARLRAKRKK